MITQLGLSMTAPRGALGELCSICTSTYMIESCRSLGSTQGVKQWLQTVRASRAARSSPSKATPRATGKRGLWKTSRSLSFREASSASWDTTVRARRRSSAPSWVPLPSTGVTSRSAGSRFARIPSPASRCAPTCPTTRTSTAFSPACSTSTTWRTCSASAPTSGHGV